jgi:hypothetical protein
MIKHYRPGLPSIPERMRGLPVDQRGYPVPWFVSWLDGEPDFRVVHPARVLQAIGERRCWVCGQRLDGVFSFVIGPMCAINRISGEPPSHYACAAFSIKACPFLSLPTAKRRDADLPDDKWSPGKMIARNPGVTLHWTTRDYSVVPSGKGVLVQLGKPEKLSAWHRGRLATKAELASSIIAGLPALIAACDQDADPADSRRFLGQMTATACKLLGLKPAPLVGLIPA